MLVLGRKQAESILIGGEIEITIIHVQGNRVRIGINAPNDMPVIRKELDQRILPIPGQNAKSCV